MLQQRPAPSQASPAPIGAQVANPAAGRGTVLPALEVSIQRLEEIVEQETFALRERQTIDLKEYNNRKSQALLELMRTLRHLDGTAPSPALMARVSSLKSKLAANQAVLRLHLEAVREITTSLSDAIRHSESDGTYTQAISSIRRA
jgi:hypothetical protein